MSAAKGIRCTETSACIARLRTSFVRCRSCVCEPDVNARAANHQHEEQQQQQQQQPQPQQQPPTPPPPQQRQAAAAAVGDGGSRGGGHLDARGVTW